MTRSIGTTSRRRLLRGAVAGIAGASIIGHGAATDRDQYIVGTASERARHAASREAVDVRRELDFGAIGQAVVGRFPDAALEALRNRADVRYVEPDERVDLLGQTVDHGVERIEAPDAHISGADGDGAHVSIIDTGIDPTHETLEANLGAGYAPEPCDDCGEERQCG